MDVLHSKISEAKPQIRSKRWSRTQVNDEFSRLDSYSFQRTKDSSIYTSHDRPDAERPDFGNLVAKDEQPAVTFDRPLKHRYELQDAQVSVHVLPDQSSSWKDFVETDISNPAEDSSYESSTSTDEMMA